MRAHPRRLSEAGISPWRYAELRAVCRQYPEAKRKLERARRGIVDRRRSSGAWRQPDPTGNAAINIAAMPEARTVRLVEQCAGAVADRATAEALIRCVTEGTEYDRLWPRPPCGVNQFYVTRQMFFIELDRRLHENEDR